MGVNATGTLGVSQVERRRRENRGAVRGEEGGSGEGLCPFPQNYEFFISKWCDMVHSECVVFKIHVSHGHRRRKGSVVGEHNGSCRARAYNEGLGAEPPAGSRDKAPGQGVRRQSPPPLKLKASWSLDVQRSRQI